MNNWTNDKYKQISIGPLSSCHFCQTWTTEQVNKWTHEQMNSFTQFQFEKLICIVELQKWALSNEVCDSLKCSIILVFSLHVFHVRKLLCIYTQLPNNKMTNEQHEQLTNEKWTHKCTKEDMKEKWGNSWPSTPVCRTSPHIWADGVVTD